MGNDSTLFTNDTRRTLILSLIVVGIGIAVYFIIQSQKHQPAVNTAKRVEIAAVTPLSYTMISGKVSAVDQEKKTVDVEFIRIDQAGTASTRAYTVSVDEKTTLQSIDQSVTPATASSITLADLVVGDEVAALSDQELANLSAFTATKIIRTK